MNMQIVPMYEAGTPAPGIFYPVDPGTTYVEPGVMYEQKFESPVPIPPPLDWLAGNVISWVKSTFEGVDVTYLKIDGKDIRMQFTRRPAPGVAIAPVLLQAIAGLIISIVALLIGIGIFLWMTGIIKPGPVWDILLILIGIGIAAGAIAGLVYVWKGGKPKVPEFIKKML